MVVCPCARKGRRGEGTGLVKRVPSEETELPGFCSFDNVRGSATGGDETEECGTSVICSAAGCTLMVAVLSSKLAVSSRVCDVREEKTGSWRSEERGSPVPNPGIGKMSNVGSPIGRGSVPTSGAGFEVQATHKAITPKATEAAKTSRDRPHREVLRVMTVRLDRAVVRLLISLAALEAVARSAAAVRWRAGADEWRAD